MDNSVELYDKLVDNNILFTVSGARRKIDTFYYKPGTIIEENSAFLSGSTLFSMGYGSYAFSPLHVDVKVGRYSSIAHNVKIMGGRHPIERFSSSSATYDYGFRIYNDFQKSDSFVQKPIPRKGNDVSIEIGNDVWVGIDVMLGRNVKIGHGAVVAAGAIVTKDVEPYSIVGGVPAKIIGYRFSYGQIKELLHLNWWDYDISKLNIDAEMNIDDFIETIKTAIDNNTIEKLDPKKVVL